VVRKGIRWYRKCLLNTPSGFGCGHRISATGAGACAGRRSSLPKKQGGGGAAGGRAAPRGAGRSPGPGRQRGRNSRCGRVVGCVEDPRDVAAAPLRHGGAHRAGHARQSTGVHTELDERECGILLVLQGPSSCRVRPRHARRGCWLSRPGRRRRRKQEGRSRRVGPISSAGRQGAPAAGGEPGTGRCLPRCGCSRGALKFFPAARTQGREPCRRLVPQVERPRSRRRSRGSVNLVKSIAFHVRSQ